MATGDYYQTLFEALCTRSMGKLAKAAYDVLHMPIVVTDSAFIVRAKYPTAPVDDEQWDANIVNRQIEPRFVKTFTDDDHFTHHAEAGSTILTDWGHYEQAPRLTSILKLDDQVFGYFAALATGVDVQPWHYEACDAICEAFSMLMNTDAAARFSRPGLTSPTLYSLLDEKLPVEQAFEVADEEFFLANQPPYLLLCAHTVNPHNAPLEVYLGNELAQYFEHVIQTVYAGDLYLLACEISKEARGSVRAKLFAEALEGQNLICGASRRFESLGEIRSRAWEARRALRVGVKLSLDGPLYHYEDRIVEVICDYIDEFAPNDVLENEALAALRAHDEEYGTAYLETMRAYLASGYDKKKTCEELHIHRNTLQYRLDRIWQMQGVDVNEALYSLYFALEDYRKRLQSTN